MRAKPTATTDDGGGDGGDGESPYRFGQQRRINVQDPLRA
jgi:hypothetical protein